MVERQQLQQLQKKRDNDNNYKMFYELFYVSRRKKENISNMRVLFYYILLHISWLPNAYTDEEGGWEQERDREERDWLYWG